MLFRSEADPITQMPEPFDVQVTMQTWEPGRMRAAIAPGAPKHGYLTVAENFTPGWEATVDGVPTPVTRGDVTLITVPVPAGARLVELRYRAPGYAAGRLITYISLVIVLGACVGPALVRVGHRT